MSSSHRILAGLAAGVALGVLLGDYARPLQWVADAYVNLLQMTVLPFVTVSIVGGLGRLRPADARALGLRTFGVLVLLWLIAFTFMFLIAFSFPHGENASFFSTTLVEPRPSFNFIDLYIPSNPFHSLAESVVPAVVLFSILAGIALIGVDRKDRLLELLDVAREVLSRIARGVIWLTPFGLFAIAATAAGTLSLEQLGRLQVYLVAYVLVSLLVTLWVLPGLVAALTGIRIREIFAASRDGLMTAFVVGDLFIVLPTLIKATETLLSQHVPDKPTACTLPDVVVPASFNFPHTAKLLSLSFVLFAGWFSDASISVADYPLLAITALFSAFGSVNVAVSFLLDLFRIPADTFQLFVASGVINSHFGSLLSAMHTLTVGVLGSCATIGALRLRRRPIVRYVVMTTALSVVIVGGARVPFATVLAPNYTKDDTLTLMHVATRTSDVVVYRARADVRKGRTGDALERIHESGILRVGYLSNALPYAFFNRHGELVGFDVELADRLASELGARLELVPVARGELVTDLADGYCDIVMSGFPVTTDFAERMLLSDPYIDETLAFVVPDARRDIFRSWESIRAAGRLTLGIPDVRYYVDKVRMLAPAARLQTIPDLTAAFTAPAQLVDAIVLPAERGSAWTLLYPRYTVVVPEGETVKVPLAFPVASGDQRFLTFINTWIELKRKDGTLDRLYRYWILGQDRVQRGRRWSVIRDVLHWVD